MTITSHSNKSYGYEEITDCKESEFLNYFQTVLDKYPRQAYGTTWSKHGSKYVITWSQSSD